MKDTSLFITDEKNWYGLSFQLALQLHIKENLLSGFQIVKAISIALDINELYDENGLTLDKNILSDFMWTISFIKKFDNKKFPLSISYIKNDNVENWIVFSVGEGSIVNSGKPNKYKSLIEIWYKEIFFKLTSYLTFNIAQICNENNALYTIEELLKEPQIISDNNQICYFISDKYKSKLIKNNFTNISFFSQKP